MSKRSGKRTDPFYLSAKWEKIRQQVLRRDNYHCLSCGTRCLGKLRGDPPPHVDHIIERKERLDLELDPSNLQTLCPSCHSKKTRASQLADQLDRPAIGEDGYPVAI